MQLWLMAIACGISQVMQAMTNGSAARAGFGAIWAGAISATVSMITLMIVGLVIYRLPFPDGGLLAAQGWKTVAGGVMGAIIVAGLAFVAPRLGPTQTFILYFFAIAVASVLIDSFGLMGAAAKPPSVRQLLGVAMAGIGAGARKAVGQAALKTPAVATPRLFGPHFKQPDVERERSVVLDREMRFGFGPRRPFCSARIDRALSSGVRIRAIQTG